MIMNAYKWGLKPKEVKALTWREYLIMELAMTEKDCEVKAIVRSLRTDIINFSGVVSKMYTPQQVQSIPIIDNMNMIIPIKNIEQALRLLKEFK